MWCMILHDGIIHLVQIPLLCVVSTPANLLTTCLFGLDKQMWLPACSAAKHMGKGKGSFDPRQSTKPPRACFLMFYAWTREYAWPPKFITYFNSSHEYATEPYYPASRAYLQPHNSDTLLQVKKLYYLSKLKNRPDSFLYHVGLSTVVLSSKPKTTVCFISYSLCIIMRLAKKMIKDWTTNLQKRSWFHPGQKVNSLIFLIGCAFMLLIGLWSFCCKKYHSIQWSTQQKR